MIEGTNQWPVFHIAYMEENCSAVFIRQNCSCLCIKSAVLVSHCHFFNLPLFVHFNKNALFFFCSALDRLEQKKYSAFIRCLKILYFVCILEMFLLSVRLIAHWQQEVVLQALKHYCYFALFLCLCQDLFLFYCCFLNKRIFH